MDTSETLINEGKFKKCAIKPILKHYSFHLSHWQRETTLTEGRANNGGMGSWPCVLEPDFLEHSFPRTAVGALANQVSKGDSLGSAED